MNGSLVDEELYPRNDIDVYAVRQSRQKIICIYFLTFIFENPFKLKYNIKMLNLVFIQVLILFLAKKLNDSLLNLFKFKN